MTTPVASSMAFISGATGTDSNVSARRTYRTSTSFVAVHSDRAEKLFEIDVLVRSTPTCEPIQARYSAVAA